MPSNPISSLGRSIPALLELVQPDTDQQLQVSEVLWGHLEKPAKVIFPDKTLPQHCATQSTGLITVHTEDLRIRHWALARTRYPSTSIYQSLTKLVKQSELELVLKKHRGRLRRELTVTQAQRHFLKPQIQLAETLVI